MAQISIMDECKRLSECESFLLILRYNHRGVRPTDHRIFLYAIWIWKPGFKDYLGEIDSKSLGLKIISTIFRTCEEFYHHPSLPQASPCVVTGPGTEGKPSRRCFCRWKFHCYSSPRRPRRGCNRIPREGVFQLTPNWTYPEVPNITFNPGLPAFHRRANKLYFK